MGAPAWGVLVVAALFAVACSQLFEYFWAQWNKDHSPFGFGYLVPPTIVYLLWCKRGELRKAQVRSGHWASLAVVLVAVIALLVGLLSSFNLVQSVAFFALLLAVPYYLWGPDIFRHIWGPLAFSATMIPWPEQLTSKILLPSQLLSTNLAAWLLQLVGVRTMIDGTQVQLPNYGFEVAKACSGLTILFPVIAIAILTVMMVEAAWWRKAAVLFLAIPISMLANALRIALIGLIGNSGGASLANSLHDSSGLVGVFIAIILLTLVQWAFGCMHYHAAYMPSFGRDEKPKEDPS